MDDRTKNAIKKLLEKRKAYEAARDSIISGGVQSYGITGSVNATNLSLADIDTAIGRIDRQISSLCGQGTPFGVLRPDYNGDILR